MDYPLAISPDLRIDAEVFVSAWNQDTESNNIAQACVDAATKESYPFVSPDMIHQGLVLLAGVAGTVTLDILKNVVKDQIMKYLKARYGYNPAPQFEVIVIQPGDKTMIIVKSKA